ncbi:MAG TPA: aspartyl protease family protein [Steroidobacteraceae bacterium]|nr:aspartyl protease family protein [Steroidobacteraceae bacterium]
MRTHDPVHNLVFCAALLALAVCHRAGARPVQLTLRPYANTELRTLQVTVNGHESPFIFDTGAGMTVLTPEEVRYAACTPFGQVTGFRADGGKVISARCGPVTLTVADYRVEREVAEFDLAKLLGKGAPPIGGILGLASFDGRAVTLDLAHDRVTIETRRSLARRIRGMRPISVRIVRGAGGDVVPFIEARAKTGTLWMEVDSGNDGPVFLAPYAQRQLGISIPVHGKRALDLDVIGLGPVPVTAGSRDMIYDGQLDPAFLRQIQLTIDFGRGKAWARFDDGKSR